MKQILLTVGIDISKAEFHVCIAIKYDDGSVKIKGKHSFANNYEGFLECISYVAKRKNDDCEVLYVMEATGSYYENLALYLHDNQQPVAVVLANKIKHFAKSHNVKSKTDKKDSELIARYGQERNPSRWKPMSKGFRNLRDYSRELLSIKTKRTMAKNQLHALSSTDATAQKIIEFKEQEITFYDKQLKEIESMLLQEVEKDTVLHSRVKKVATIKGIGLSTVITILCETNGFELFSNIRQVVSYAGLDVSQNESGTIQKRTKISKKGNSRIRSCLYMPALSAIQHNQSIIQLHARIVERNPTIKKKGIVAAMRKLLILVFVLWKKNEEFDPNYQWKTA